MSKKHHHRSEPSPEPAVETPPPSQADGAEPVAEPIQDLAPRAEGRGPAIGEVEELNDKYLRLAAEYDNYRRRTAKERVELTGRAQGDLVRAIIDPLDDLARVIAQGPGAADAKTVLDAVEVVDKKMMKALVAAGLEIINPIGLPFDPTQHEAVSTAPAAGAEEDHLVAQVFQQGYLFKGQLLRAARVVVKQWNG